MKIFFAALLLTCLSFSTAHAQDLTWQDLVNKPEFKPAFCTVNQSMDFEGGMSIKAGQKVEVLEINPNEIIVADPGTGKNFILGPEETDVLKAANLAYSQLTPKQRELTYAHIISQKELLPYRLKLKETLNFGQDRINKGDTVFLLDVKNSKLVLAPSSFKFNFELDPQQTDLLEQARIFVETPQGAPGLLAEELEGNLVNAATGQPVTIDAKNPPKYFVIFHGARWCPYTQQFTPDFLKAYQGLKSKHPEFEVIYYPAEKSAQEVQMYAKELNFPWPAVAYQKRAQLVNMARIVGQGKIPALFVVDKYGQRVIDSSIERSSILKELEILLDKKS